jgi:hypothetical protein
MQTRLTNNILTWYSQNTLHDIQLQHSSQSSCTNNILFPKHHAHHHAIHTTNTHALITYVDNQPTRSSSQGTSTTSRPTQHPVVNNHASQQTNYMRSHQRQYGIQTTTPHTCSAHHTCNTTSTTYTRKISLDQPCIVAILHTAHDIQFTPQHPVHNNHAAYTSHQFTAPKLQCKQTILPHEHALTVQHKSHTHTHSTLSKKLHGKHAHNLQLKQCYTNTCHAAEKNFQQYSCSRTIIITNNLQQTYSQTTYKQVHRARIQHSQVHIACWASIIYSNELHTHDRQHALATTS